MNQVRDLGGVLGDEESSSLYFHRPQAVPPDAALQPTSKTRLIICLAHDFGVMST